MASDVTTAVESVYRGEWGKIVATLIKLFGDFEMAGAMMQNQPVVKAGKSTIFTSGYDVTIR